MSKAPVFNILAVVQSGRLQYEALLLAASLRASNPDFQGKLYLAEPQQGGKWKRNPAVSNPEIRANLPIYANWPTFPQLWVDGELIGGCDIIAEMETSGELAEVIKAGASDSE